MASSKRNILYLRYASTVGIGAIHIRGHHFVDGFTHGCKVTDFTELVKAISFGIS